MNTRVQLSDLPHPAPGVFVAERKGLGHPDTICDGLAEEFSRALSRYYIDEFGVVFHHNVDKALLCGGRVRVTFGGAELLEPMELYLAGRATARVAGRSIPIGDLARESVFRWFASNVPELDVEKHLRIHCVTKEGSAELLELFDRHCRTQVVLANDTSLGVGYAPLSPFEQLVLDAERELNSTAFRLKNPAGGADVKIMGTCDGTAASLTVARAFVAQHVHNVEEYVEAKRVVRDTIFGLAEERGLTPKVGVNVADDLEAGSLYLTLTGLSAESGDDGQVGRGNRANGLITPSRPMSMEAVAGKNPVNHVGKLYNIAAKEIAERIVAQLPEVTLAVCYLLSEIGHPIDEPRLIRVELATGKYVPSRVLQRPIEQIVSTYLAGLDTLTNRLIQGTAPVF